MKELLPIPLNLPRQHEFQHRHDLDDLDNLWFIKWKLRISDGDKKKKPEN